MIWHTAIAIALLPVAQPTADTTRVCVAPASVQMAAGNNAAAIDAVRGAFTSFLTGPSLAVKPMTSRLASQVREEEAKAADCPYLLLTTFKHERKVGTPCLARPRVVPSRKARGT